MEVLIPIIIVLVIGLVIAGIVFSYYQEKKRREALGRIAASMGFQFDIKDPFEIASRHGDIGVLAAGHNRSAYNVVHGSRGPYAVKAFDYVYHTTETSTDSRGQTTTREVSHYFSAVIFEGKAVFLNLFIRPENFFDKIAAAIGFDDIDFESAEFSRKFYVKADNKKFAYDVIHPRMMEFLLTQPYWTIQLQGHSILATRGSMFRPEEFRGAIEFVDAFLKQIPDFVWEQLRAK